MPAVVAPLLPCAAGAVDLSSVGVTPTITRKGGTVRLSTDTGCAHLPFRYSSVHTRAVSTRKLERSLYLVQRTLGDARAAQSGRLTKRVARRYVARSLFRLFR